MWKCCKQIKTVRCKEEDRGKRSFFLYKIKNREKKNNLQHTLICLRVDGGSIFRGGSITLEEQQQEQRYKQRFKSSGNAG
jgi:hypothetical protein